MRRVDRRGTSPRRWRRRGARRGRPSATRGAGREVRDRAAAHRDPGVRRRPRAGGASLRARLLAAAAAPEGDRGGAGAGDDRRRCARRWGRRRCRRRRRSATSGAGTVEFIADGSGPLRPDGFWFMEMNTRLQVEHPVTEAITGRGPGRVAAAGRRRASRCRSGRRSWRSTGMRSRRGSTPRTRRGASCRRSGRLTHLAFPPGVRVDSGVRAGDAISPWYDPMIAKVIAHGPTRDDRAGAAGAGAGGDAGRGVRDQPRVPGAAGAAGGLRRRAGRHRADRAATSRR